ncbi:LOW QUALITY PROTEIN: uncharacterized protein EMH_0052440 [Eimeria mitis]|uniref:Transmembrane protein n=1 Tax=Eimeria mitis TaxID=44415 RepID=U6K0C4_9EIME|nr:LOW QUALITY PROTEIN: uncharacterized protein EMH_0052440 [Eimeria mitis]CDJ29762.1 hypothetical protein EMH_0052440 [Eimeria mitis]
MSNFKNTSGNKQPREDLDGGSPSSLYPKRHNGRIGLTIAAFSSIFAILFLVSHCVALSRQALPKHTGRRLAGEQATKKHGSGSLVQEACGAEGSESGIATGRRGISAEPSGADAPAGWSVYGEPPKKKKKEVLGEQLETSRIPSDVVDRSVAPTQTGGPTDVPGSSGHTAVAQHLPEEGTAGSASPVEGSLQCSKSSVGITSPASDVQSFPRDAVTQLREHLLAAQTASKKTLLFKYIVGQPGTKGAYMLLGSEISNLQGRPALVLASTPLSGNSESQEGLREVDFTSHPFFRLPSVSPNALVRGIILKRWKLFRRWTLSEGRALLGIKELLKKPVLGADDLLRLIKHLEHLVEFAVHHPVGTIDDGKPNSIVERLGLALVMVDAIFAASEFQPSEEDHGHISWLMIKSGSSPNDA